MNGYKISNPTILARKTDAELTQYFEGMGWKPYFVEGNDADKLNPEMAKVMDQAIEEIKSIQENARREGAENVTRPNWPVLIVRTPKGWTGPKTWDNNVIEGSFRAHQIPIPVDQHHMEHVGALTDWLNSYGPEELFDENGRLIQELEDLTPKGNHRMAMNPITNGGINPKPLKMPDYRQYALDNSKRGQVVAQDMLVMSDFIGDIIRQNPDNFRLFGPDETMSNRLYDAFEASPRQWLEATEPGVDQYISPEGRIIDSQLSEHQAEGLLEGYVLTGRHGFFSSYEAFLRVVDSMITQHFKWLRKANEMPWRKKYPSLNVLATSTSFQQDHNGYTHQDPGIITHLAEKKT